MEFREKRNYNDIDAESVYATPGVVAIVCVLVFLFVVLITWGADTRESDIEFNEYAAEFNALPESTRIAAIPFIEHEIPEGQTVLDFKEVPDAYGVQFARAMPVVIVLFLLVLSMATFLSYWREKSSRYFLADLPMHNLYGWALLMSMFAGWPILMVSFVRMMTHKYQTIGKKEIRAVERQMEDHDLRYEKPTAPMALARSIKARARYINYRVNDRYKAASHRCEELNECEAEQRKELQNLGELVKAKQRRIGEILAEKKQLEGAKIPEQETREKAIAEWEAIVQMRGVSTIAVKRSKGEKIQPLTFDVKVRVPYENNLYDFGDYRVVIEAGRFSCKRIRSGIKTNATSSRPDYNEASGFCFGSRRSVINDYVRNGRLLEAITLIVDSLHAVNDGYAESMIPYCFRKVATVRRIERWLKIKKKLGVRK